MSDSSSKRKYAGIDLAAARAQLAGATVGSFDYDFLAIDEAGRIGVFLGDPDSPVPSQSAARMASTVLEELAVAVRARLAAAETTNGYRDAAARPIDLVFDTPRADARTSLHETPMNGYPQLVVATPDGAAAVRGLLADYAGRELLARDGFAIEIEVLGAFSSEEIHRSGACAGCRVLTDPSDPHPRSPEALATMGLYVYAYSGNTWLRVVSPSTPADRDDLPDTKLVRASTLHEEVLFDDTAWRSGNWFQR